MVKGPRLPERPLFADSLLHAEKSERNRRKFATVFSLMIQGLLLGVLLILPLMFTQALPQQQLLTFLVAPPPPPPPPPPAAQAVAKLVRRTQSEMLGGGLRAPSRIPAKIQMIHEVEAPPPSPSGVVGGVPGGVPGGQLGGVIGGIIGQTSSLSAVPRPPVSTQPKRIRISQGVTQGSLIHKIEPGYPTLAMRARISGLVVLHAIISKEGEIKELSLVSGHPLLAPAAIEAVRQWRYRPFLLNGEPIEVETTITVTFQLTQ
jgi:protein TonB